MKYYLSPNVVKTWLLLASSQDKTLAQQRETARVRIEELFGSEEIASIYVDQVCDGYQDVFDVDSNIV